MSARLRTPATYEDVLRAPENMVAELVGGDLHLSPRPGYPHVRFTSAAQADLGSALDRGRPGPDGWWILTEPEVHLGTDVVVPDLAGWRRARMPVMPSSNYTEIAPDWICEVLSPSTSRLDRSRKLPVYAAHAVAHAWLADPTAQTVEVLRLENERWVLLHVFGGDDRMRAEPFEEVEIDLASIWGPPPQR